jgi:pyruvate dehydrogenase E2 component (dihydrolipoamide acetyltransferase)
MAELLRMPEIAAGMESAILSTWLIAENTPHSAGDVIAVIETDKAVVDVEAEGDGVILRTLVHDGAEVPVGAPIALMADTTEIITDIDATLLALGVGDSKPGEPTPDSVLDELPASPPVAASSHAPTQITRLFASPLARRLAKDADVDISQIIGTGPGGRIVRRDIEGAISNVTPRHTPTEPTVPAKSIPATSSTAQAFTDTPHSRLRRAIAARLTESKQSAPHFYLRGTAQVDRLLSMREELNAGAPSRISVNDLVIKAVAKAHTLVPALNVIWTPEAIRSFHSVDIAVAMATTNGLVTPVLRSVEMMTVSAVSARVKDFAERAQSGRLQQHELEGGSISVTNLGMHGTEEFAAIINPPQAAILAIGAARQEAVAIEGAVRVATVMRVTLSIDHRPVDGVTGAAWMSTFLHLLENPAKILS